MDIKIRITVHVYADDCLQDDKYLRNDSDYCGIIGPETLIPLKRANGNTYIITNVNETFSVRELWTWIENMLYQKIESPYYDSVLDYVRRIGILEKYLSVNGLRYTLQYTEKPLMEYLKLLGISISEVIDIQLLVSGDAGDLCYGDGIRYYIPSGEEGSHHEPHVHADIRHEDSGTFSLITGNQLQKEKKVKPKDAKKIEKMILSHQKEWIKYWNEHTTGLNVDLNQAFGLIGY